MVTKEDHNNLGHSMELLNQTFQIINLHQVCINAWKQGAIQLREEKDLLKLVEQNHAYNFQLWQAEDRARRDDLGYEFVCQAKREIDALNQQRNNCMEAIDEWLFNTLQPASPSACAVHSETPGMMIDRLSILALKIFHMRLCAERVDRPHEYQQKCTQALMVLQEQQQQLHRCLHELLIAINNKTRTFRIYFQFKMYNDPTLRKAYS